MEQRWIDKLKAAELTDAQRNLLAAGLCPGCERPCRGRWVPVPDGSAFMRPEIYESLRERGIDTATGHKKGCEFNGMRTE